MARRIKDVNLESRDARLKFKVSGKPYWRAIGRGLHLGYRKGKTGGVWVVRRYLGQQSYQLHTIAQTDDTLDANGVEVLDFWQAQEAARNMREGPPPKIGGYTVADAIRDYLEHLEGKASHRDVTQRMNAYVLPALGDKPVAKLEADEIKRWHRSIAKTPARRRTAKGAPQEYRMGDMSDPEIARRRQVSANRILSHLKAALNLAWQEKKKTGITDRDAWERVKLFERVDIPRTRHLSLAESKRLINASEGDFRALIRAALETGARYSELARLRVADLNSDAGTLHIRMSKTGAKHIVLTTDGKAFFSQLAVGRPGSELLLGREWKRNHQNSPLRKACERARISPPINFHALRHTWASLALMGGVDRMVVAKNLGHADTRMIDLHYAHLSPGYVTKQIRAKAPRFGKIASNVKPLRA
jgi:integrase